MLVVATVGISFQTWLQSRSSHVNAVAVADLLRLALGTWGLVLGAPLIAIGKTVADRLAPPMADLLG